MRAAIYEKFLECVRRHRVFLITTHITPDPDAICSELAMARFLMAAGKKVMIINADGVPERLRFLPGAQRIGRFREDRKLKFDVILALDSGDLERIGRVQSLLTSEKILINVDHHVTSHLFGDLNIVREDASSTAEVIYDLLKYTKFPMDRNMAILLYVGIMTDTGSFRYENTLAHTHAVVAELLKFGFRPATYYQKLYETVPLSDFKYFTRVVCRFEVFEGGRVMGLQLPKDTVRRFSAEFDLRDKLFRELRAIKGVEVVFILTEDKKDVTRANFRAHGPIDVAALAAIFGGGGHRKASGCLVNLPMPLAKAAVLHEIRKVL